MKAAADGTLLLGTATNPPTAGVTITITVPPVGNGKGKGGAISTLAAKGGGKKAAKPVVIAKAHVAVPTGKTVPLKVKLSAKAQAMLGKRALHATLSLVATSAAGTDGSETQPLTITAPPKKKSKGK